jgi:hypothetical protein
MTVLVYARTKASAPALDHRGVRLAAALAHGLEAKATDAPAVAWLLGEVVRHRELRVSDDEVLHGRNAAVRKGLGDSDATRSLRTAKVLAD